MFNSVFPDTRELVAFGLGVGVTAVVHTAIGMGHAVGGILSIIHEAPTDIAQITVASLGMAGGLLTGFILASGIIYNNLSLLAFPALVFPLPRAGVQAA